MGGDSLAEPRAKGRWIVFLIVAAIAGPILIGVFYASSAGRSREPLRAWVEQQNFIFIVPAREGLLPGDVIQWPIPVPGGTPSDDMALYQRSEEVFGHDPSTDFVKTGPFEVTLYGSIESGIRAGVITPIIASELKGKSAEEFQLVLKDVEILEAPVASLQQAIEARPALVSALRDPNRTVVARILRPGRFEYRYSLGAESGFVGKIKNLLGMQNSSFKASTDAKFSTLVATSSDRPMVIGLALAKLDPFKAGSAIQTLPFSQSRTLQADPSAGLWPVGTRLRVGFLGGTDAQKAFFRESISDWLQYANLGVEYGDAAKADIRVSFADKQGSWSYVGTQALRAPAGQPTMILGNRIDQPGAKQSYLHEIGHALGLVHEFQNPGVSAIWNRQALEAYFAGPPMFWSRDQIQRSFFDTTHYPGNRPVDLKSVMSYQLPASVYRDYRRFTPGDTLSSSDRSYIASIYPRFGPS